MPAPGEPSTLTGSSSGGDSGNVQRGEQLFVVLHGDRPLTAPSRHDLAGIDEILFGRSSREVQVARRDRRLDVLVPDPRVSSMHARLERTPFAWSLRDLESKNGTFVGEQRIAGAFEIGDGSLFAIGSTFFTLRMSQPLDGAPDVIGPPPSPLPGLSTMSAERAVQHAALAKVASSETPILVLGESGTGKEWVARAVHAAAGRAGALVPVNCGGLPTGLVASELFGHRRGAFSGADADRTGFVMTAHGGTLFLDEIGDLPSMVQPTLLRVLQEREVTPLGAARPIPVDLRVISATHRDLLADVATDRFRRDLYGRLAGFTVTLPPLRARREDLGLIVADVIRRHAPDPSSVSLARSTALALFTHLWPQNIRELENAFKVALALGAEGPLRIAVAPPSTPPSPSPPPFDPDTPDDGEPRAAKLIRLLGEHGGNVAAVARALGKQRTMVHRWLREEGIDPGAYRKED